MLPLLWPFACLLSVKLHVFKDALVISDSLFGVMPIPYKDIQSMLYYNGVSSVAGGVVGLGRSGGRRKLRVEGIVGKSGGGGGVCMQEL